MWVIEGQEVRVRSLQCWYTACVQPHPAETSGSLLSVSAASRMKGLQTACRVAKTQTGKSAYSFIQTMTTVTDNQRFSKSNLMRWNKYKRSTRVQCQKSGEISGSRGDEHGYQCLLACYACRLVDINKRFGRAYCLRNQGDKDRGSTRHRNVGQYLKDYTAQDPTRQTSSYKILLWNPQRKKSLVRHKRRRKDNIKTDLCEREWQSPLDWTGSG
jgi:hypothetical protein